MTPIYGDITLVNGRINNLKSETGTVLPTFTADDAGRIFFLSSNNTLNVNDGNEWVVLQFSNTDISSPLLVTLGQNWINNDLSFNPTPFNALNNIHGLTSNDSLFSVVAALDSAITSISSEHLADLADTTFGNLNAGDIVIWNGTSFSNISMNNLANARLTLNTTSLKDVLVSSYNAGDSLVYSASENKLVNRQTSFTYTNTATDSEFAVSHNLGVQFPFIQVINYATKLSVSPSFYSISYDTLNSFTLTLNNGQTAIPVVIIVFALNAT